MLGYVALLVSISLFIDGLLDACDSSDWLACLDAIARGCLLYYVGEHFFLT